MAESVAYSVLLRLLELDYPKKMPPRDAPSNWLSKITRAKRGSIERLSPRQRNEAECASIIGAINAHPQGKPLADHPKLQDALFGALVLADEMDRQAIPVVWAPTDI
jgi:hypothetical protein